MSGSFFDASSSADRNDGSAPENRKPNPFLGIQFECCKVYGRIYRSDGGSKYTGRCPRCLKKISVPISRGGSGSRFFRAS